MKKYNIEGNLDFFSELYKSLDEEDNTESNNNDNLCLITNQLLVDKFIELNCGHKFNYIPLYNDIYNHKKKFNNMEGSASSLKMNEIRCPYCRKKQLGVLPYYQDLISAKTNGVNFYDDIQTPMGYVSSHGKFVYGKCEFIVINTAISTTTFSGPCQSTYVTKSECDNKTYCWNHNRIIFKKFEKEKKDKEKEIQKQLKKEAKQKEKEDKKAEEKIKKESLKKTAKKSKDLILSITDVEEENIVVSINSQIETTNEGCTQIIKSGLNKGNPCGLTILNDCLCKRHYNLKNKSNI
jgi:hypothetical protein